LEEPGAPLALRYALRITALDDCFKLGGRADFVDFLADHLQARKWIIASDYNIGSYGSEHDVYAFACYPAEEGIEELVKSLNELFPEDFKRAKSITREQARYFNKRSCFCFVFLIRGLRKFSQRRSCDRSR
jgi:hypothetical protein